MLYIKIVFLIDREKHEKNPVFERKLRRSEEGFPVYDSSIFFQFTQFSPEKPREHRWRFTSTEGQVDAMQLHPFNLTTAHADPAKRTMADSVEGILRPTPDSLVVVCHNYNGFQRERGEWAGVRAANFTKCLRLVIDFSSVMTITGEELFSELPSAYWVHELEQDPNDTSKLLETPLTFEYNDGRVFSVSQTDVPTMDIIKIKYKMNWESLVNWQGYYENKKFKPIMYI